MNENADVNKKLILWKSAVSVMKIFEPGLQKTFGFSVPIHKSKNKHIPRTVNVDKKCRNRQSYKCIKTRHAWLVCEMNGAAKPLSAGTPRDFLQ